MLLILTGLYVWIKALLSDFPYYALNLLIFAGGLIRWSNIKNIRAIISWSSQDSYLLKWNIDDSFISPSPAGIRGGFHDHKGLVLGFFLYYGWYQRFK